MVDNVTINAGAGGDVVAADDISGVKHQRVKIEFGADGSATDVSSTNPMPIGNVPRTSGGCSIFRSLDLDESEEEAKASAGQVYGWYVHNNASSVRYVKFYNATAASVTVGTTTPLMTVPIPANAGANVHFGTGIAFGTAITVAATTGVADTDTGAPAANDIQINLFYR
jgi:hypothetical protein